MNCNTTHYRANSSSVPGDPTFQEEALHAISRRAIQRKTGARGLRSIMEGILLETMFELPTLNGVQEVVITSDVVDGRSRPLYTYSDKVQARESNAS